MSTNTIFVLLALVVAVALVIYLVAVKKGKSQTPTIKPLETPEVPDDDNEGGI